MTNRFAIFVNTTDGFSDCWIPFFKLFKRFWCQFSGKIYLNTENESFQFDDLNIISIKNERFLKGKPNWGKSLVAALNFIEEDVILYMQEDYFLNDYVNTNFIEDAYQLMLKDASVSCIHITDQATPGPFEDYNGNKNFKIISPKAEYRISCQAALWRKNELKKYIRTYETPWQFELIGTRRARFLYKDTFLIIDKNQYGIGKKELLPYVFTGIIKGKWKKEVKSLFAVNEIIVDFSKRGFFNEETVFSRRKNLTWFKSQWYKIVSLSEIQFKKLFA
jgi:hypothetical protein